MSSFPGTGGLESCGLMDGNPRTDVCLDLLHLRAEVAFSWQLLTWGPTVEIPCLKDAFFGLHLSVGQQCGT